MFWEKGLLVSVATVAVPKMSKKKTKIADLMFSVPECEKAE